MGPLSHGPLPFGPGIRSRRTPVVEADTFADATWSSTELTGAELAARQADRPVILAAHCLRDAFARTTTPLARWTVTGAGFAGADIVEDGYPTYRAYDGHGHRATKPDSTFDPGSGGGVDLLVDFGADNLQSFDAIYIATLNESPGEEISVSIADDSEFSVHSETILGLVSGAPYGPASGPTATVMAHAGLGISTPARYSGVRFLKVSFGAWDPAPLLAELWLGRSYQLPRHFDTPQSDRREVSRVAGQESRCGLTARRTRSVGGAQLPAGLTLSGDVEAGEAFEHWWQASRRGVCPVVLINNPYTGAIGRLVRTPGAPVFDPEAAEPPGWARRSLAVELAEAAPFYGDMP